MASVGKPNRGEHSKMYSSAPPCRLLDWQSALLLALTPVIHPSTVSAQKFDEVQAYTHLHPRLPPPINTGKSNIVGAAAAGVDMMSSATKKACLCPSTELQAILSFWKSR